MKTPIKDKQKDSEMRTEYDFSNAQPNPYADRYAEGTNLVVIDPDLADYFPDSASVNQALRALLSAFPSAQLSQKQPSRQG